MSTTRLKRGFVSGVLLLAILSLSALREADGVLAFKTTIYHDRACEEETGWVGLGFAGITGTTIGDFNECQAWADDTTSIINVCDATTGETGFKVFADQTCTELDDEFVSAPSCISSPGECVGSTVCGAITACTDDVASAISPTAVNYIAAEYNDANCTDPTGDTVVVSGLAGECAPVTGFNSMGECRADGSALIQGFSAEDNTCSGDVLYQSTSPTESSPPLCSEGTAGGLYYGVISCTSGAATVFIETTAPASVPIGIPPSPSPITEVHDDTPPPTTGVDVDDTLADTPAPTSDTDGEAEDTTPAPAAAGVDGDSVDFTPAPASGGGSRGVRVTAPPTVSVTSGEFEETPSPIGDNEATLSNGTAGIGNGGAAGAFALSFAIGLSVYIAM